MGGKPVRIRSPRDAIEAGIGMVHQHFMLIPVMTVAENVVLASEPRRGPFLDLPAARARVRAVSERLGLGVDPDARIEELSVGPAAAGRDRQGALPRRADPDPGRAHGGAHAPGGDRPVRDPERASKGHGHVDHLHHPQARRGARAGRPDHGAAPRPGGRDRAPRGRDRAEPGPADGRARGAAAGREAAGPSRGAGARGARPARARRPRPRGRAGRLARRPRGRDRRHRRRRRERPVRAGRGDHGPAPGRGGDDHGRRPRPQPRERAREPRRGRRAHPRGPPAARARARVHAGREPGPARLPPPARVADGDPLAPPPGQAGP